MSIQIPTANINADSLCQYPCRPTPQWAAHIICIEICWVWNDMVRGGWLQCWLVRIGGSVWGGSHHWRIDAWAWLLAMDWTRDSGSWSTQGRDDRLNNFGWKLFWLWGVKCSRSKADWSLNRCGRVIIRSTNLSAQSLNNQALIRCSWPIISTDIAGADSTVCDGCPAHALH